MDTDFKWEVVQWLMILWLNFSGDASLNRLRTWISSVEGELLKTKDDTRNWKNLEERLAVLNGSVSSLEWAVGRCASERRLDKVQSRIVELKHRLLAIEDYLNAQSPSTTPSELPAATSDEKSLMDPQLDNAAVPDSVDEADSSSGDQGSDPATVDIMEALRASLENLKQSSWIPQGTPGGQEAAMLIAPQDDDEVVQDLLVDGEVDPSNGDQGTDPAIVDLMEAPTRIARKSQEAFRVSSRNPWRSRTPRLCSSTAP